MKDFKCMWRGEKWERVRVVEELRKASSELHFGKLTPGGTDEDAALRRRTNRMQLFRCG
jgi:hypothetical protein